MLSKYADVKFRLRWSDPGSGNEQTHQQRLPLTIGRTPDNDIVLNSSRVSRQHARIEIVNNQVMLIDQDTGNGTFIDGERISQKRLYNGSRFDIPPFEFTIGFDDPETESKLVTKLVIELTRPKQGDQAVKEKVMVVPPITIGRDSLSTIVLSGKQVSREHVLIEVKGEEVHLTDKSRNGTYINNKAQQVAILQIGDHGDLISVGEYQLRILEIKQEEEAVGRDATEIGLGNETERTLRFDSRTDQLEPSLPAIIAPPPSSSAKFPPPVFERKRHLPVAEIRRANVGIHETTYLTIGGGVGSFSWVDHLRIYGVRPEQIVAVGLEAEPYGRYRRLCRNSQIPEYERLRSNSDSCPDNIWGWPGYAVRETWHALAKGDVKSALRATWQIFGEPTLVPTYTPISGNVFTSIDREARRIGWRNIWRPGRVRAIRKTDDGRYAVAYTESDREGEGAHNIILAKYLHLSVGYPAIKLLPDLYEYRQKTEDFKKVVNVYEEHEHIYEHLKRNGGIVMVRGRGIVASRIMQRLYEIKQDGNRPIAVLHLLRRPLTEGSRFERAQRAVENHFEFQPFNWPKACWGGDLRVRLERANPRERDRLLTDWGGTTTADRQDWKDIINNGLQEGWYRREFGEVQSVEHDEKSGKIITNIRGRDAIQGHIRLEADYVIDATGLESNIDENPLLQDLVEHYKLERNPKGRLNVTNDFEIAGMENDGGHMYAAGVITLGGPYAAVDSFLGLQYAAMRSVDHLTKLNAPDLRWLDGLSSVNQWLRWARGVAP